MTAKSSKAKTVEKTGKAKGRPKGSKNVGGPILARLATKTEKSLGFLERMGTRADRWAAADETKKDLFLKIRNAVNTAYKLLDEDVAVTLKELSQEGYSVPKTAAAAIDYALGRQVWVKPTVKKMYMDDFGYDDNQLENLFVLKTVKGRVFVSVGLNGKEKIIFPKLHISVKTPSEEAAA